MSPSGGRRLKSGRPNSRSVCRRNVVTGEAVAGAAATPEGGGGSQVEEAKKGSETPVGKDAVEEKDPEKERLLQEAAARISEAKYAAMAAKAKAKGKGDAAAASH